MPSPFPGMDPYLEGELWSNFHTQFAVGIAQHLNPLIMPRYVAVTEKYQNPGGPEEIAIATEFVSPDVGVSQVTGRPLRPAVAALLEPPLKMETVIAIPVNHVWVKVLDSKNRLLVTAIEFLSPTNKRSQGRTKYLRKRTRILRSSAHLVEIDLLRKGKRIPMVEPLPDAPYFAFISPVGQRPVTDVWPIALDSPLPPIPMPLQSGDPEVPLDLQAVFTSVYDRGGMEGLIDYSEPPDVPLSPDVAVWADELLRRKGKRG